MRIVNPPNRLRIRDVCVEMHSNSLFITTGPPASRGLLCDFFAVVSCNLRAVDVLKTAVLEDFETLCL